MALDHALAAEVEDGTAVLRLYAWSSPTVSFGRNEPARGRYVADASHRGLDYVRRPTGGRAVLHDGELTYAVVAPAATLGGPRRTYRRVNEALAAALRSLGAPVTLAGAVALPALDSGPCFQSPAEGEVVAVGRKLVGSAQARIGQALLQHGSILLEGDQSRLEALRIEANARVAAGRGPVAPTLRPDRPTPSPDPTTASPDLAAPSPDPTTTSSAPATLTELLPGITRSRVADAVIASMQKTFDGTWRTDEYRQGELATARRLEAERYGRPDWTWRR